MAIVDPGPVNTMESMECSAVEWSGMESMECIAVQCSAVEWNGMEWNGMEWNGIDGMQCQDFANVREKMDFCFFGPPDNFHFSKVAHFFSFCEARSEIASKRRRATKLTFLRNAFLLMFLSVCLCVLLRFLSVLLCVLLRFLSVFYLSEINDLLARLASTI